MARTARRSAALVAACAVIALPAASARAGVTLIGAQGTGAGQFGQLAGIASDSAGNVYAVDRSGNRVEKFAPDGTLLQTIGSAGSGAGQLSQPVDVAVDGAGNVYVADGGNSRVEKFAPDGSFMATIGGPGTGTGQFQNLQNVAADSTGDVFTVDQARVQGFDAAGTYKWTASGFGSLMGLGASPAGEVFTADTIQHRIHKLSATGSDQGVVPPPADGRGFFPQDVAVDAAGNLLVWNSLLNEVEQMDGAGNVTASWSPSAGMPRAPTNTNPRVATAADTPPPPPPSGGTSSSTNPNLGPVAFAPGGGAYAASSNLGSVLRLDPSSPDIVSFETVNDNPTLTGSQHMFRARASVPFGTVASYAFDSDGDGSFETPGGIDQLGGFAAVTYAQPGHYAVRVRAAAAAGGAVESGPLNGYPFLDVRLHPPPGTVGVSINGGAQFTNTPSVQLSLVWPQLAMQVTAANDGGFVGATPRDLAPTIPWKLDSSGPERLPKTVYVHYEGLPNNVLPGGVQTSGQTITYTDDIILDQTAPKLLAASLVGSSSTSAVRAAKKATFKVRLRARDGNSGVGRAQFRVGRKASPAVAFKSVLTVRSRRPTAARVQDRAGNWSRWRPVAAKRH